jgi:uncharacterized membrane protein (UPF0127 family)
MMRFFLILPIAILCGFSISCKETETIGFNNNEIEKFEIQVAEKKLLLELAITPEKREKGLMYRDDLQSGEGMIFVFESPQPMRFWMKNTRIPLDIGYFSPDGRLKELHRGKPFDLSGMPSRSNFLQFVIELNAGDYKKLGICLGDKIDLPALAKAISQSGQDPSRYGLLFLER